jgi:hypothetical protein
VVKVYAAVNNYLDRKQEGCLFAVSSTSFLG